MALDRTTSFSRDPKTLIKKIINDSRITRSVWVNINDKTRRNKDGKSVMIDHGEEIRCRNFSFSSCVIERTCSSGDSALKFGQRN
jgi:hypothetical protein